MLVLRERRIKNAEIVCIFVNFNADSTGNALYEKPIGKYLHWAIADFRIAIIHHYVLLRLVGCKIPFLYPLKM